MTKPDQKVSKWKETKTNQKQKKILLATSAEKNTLNP